MVLFRLFVEVAVVVAFPGLEPVVALVALFMVDRLDQSVGELSECLVGVAGQLQRHVVHVYFSEDLRQLLPVDLCQLGDPVVGEQVGVLFGLAAVVLIVHRHALPAFGLGCH